MSDNTDNVGEYTFTFDFVDAAQTIALGSVLPFACVVVVILRLFVRRTQGNGLGLDDWFILFGLVNVTGMGISLIVGAALHGMGYPAPQPPPDSTPSEIEVFLPRQTIVVLKVQYIFQMLMILAYGSIKASITMFYRRLFVTRRHSVFDIITKITLVVLALWTLTFELMMIFDCGDHFKVNWGNLVEQSKYCEVLGFSGEYGMAISDLILDLIVILMPLPLVWKLHLSIAKKLAVTGILLLGASAVGASVARLVLYLQILAGLTKGAEFDNNLAVTVSMWWSLLEAGLALIAACLPTLSLAGKAQTWRTAMSRVVDRISPLSSSASKLRSNRDQAREAPPANSSPNLETKKQIGTFSLTQVSLGSDHSSGEYGK